MKTQRESFWWFDLGRLVLDFKSWKIVWSVFKWRCWKICEIDFAWGVLQPWDIVTMRGVARFKQDQVSQGYTGLMMRPVMRMIRLNLSHGSSFMENKLIHMDNDGTRSVRVIDQGWYQDRLSLTGICLSLWCNDNSTDSTFWNRVGVGILQGQTYKFESKRTSLVLRTGWRICSTELCVESGTGNNPGCIPGLEEQQK